MNRLVSAIIPTFNGIAFLAQAVASIRANSYTPLEMIVVDDGSTDSTVELAHRLDARVIVQPHSGRPAVGRNAGIRAARGEFVTFLDQDDLWTTDKLALQLECFGQQRALQVVWGQAQRLYLSNENVYAPSDPPFGNWLVSGAMFRRGVFEQVGLFDETLVYFGDDADWFLRAREQNVAMKMLDVLTLYWRMHATNASHANIRNHAQGFDHALTEVLRKSLARRRAREPLA